MADDIFKWIRNISALNDEQLKQEVGVNSRVYCFKWYVTICHFII
jgi:hypothetical protein